MDDVPYISEMENNQRRIRRYLIIAAVAVVLYTLWAIFIFLPEDCRDLAKKEGRMLCRLAHIGDTNSQVNLAQIYRHGNGVAVNYPKAFTWLNKAAENKSFDAHYILGLMHEFGEGVKPNLEHANHWYLLASELDPQSFFDQAIYQINSAHFDRGEQHLILLANQGFPDVQFTLALMYLDGPLLPNYNSAQLWLKKAAEQGHEEAQMILHDLEKHPYQPLMKQQPIWV